MIRKKNLTIMPRMFLFGLTIIILLAGCSSTSKLSQRSNTYMANTMPVVKGQHGPNADFDLSMDIVTASTQNAKGESMLSRLVNVLKSNHIKDLKCKLVDVKNPPNEEPNYLQTKYAALLNMIPSMLPSINLLQSIDNWYGTRYRYGGTTKNGIDCSAFVRAMFKSVYDVELPRTAREQYGSARRISTTELKEGDLLFFNTTGGVSHVGIYLRNNKFVHSSCSKGVTISDLYENYYISHYIGAGRVEKPDMMAQN